MPVRSRPGVEALELRACPSASARVVLPVPEPQAAHVRPATLPQAQDGYEIRTVQAGPNLERRLVFGGFHFATIIVLPGGDIVARYHPDRQDVNGFGTSHHLASFLNGGDTLRGQLDGVAVVAGGVEVRASGQIDTGGGTFGTWTWRAVINYDPAAERVSGTGTRTVTLPAPLAAAGADLNLERVASNLLLGVPRQTAGPGTTGDTAVVLRRYAPDGTPIPWTGDPPAHFPQDRSAFLSLDVTGELNTADATGVKVALKPGFRLDITSRSGTMIAGLQYDRSRAQDPFADNVGVTPIVPRDAAGTSLAFDFTFEAAEPALAGFTDDFHRTDKGAGFEGRAVDLNRAGSNGAPWVLRRGNFRIAGGVATAGTAFSTAVLDGVSAADVTVAADVDVVPRGAPVQAGFVVRDRYRALVVANPGGTTAGIQVLRAGGWATLASARLPAAQGRLEFAAAGSRFVLRFRGQDVLDVTDTTFAGAGPVGVLGQRGGLDNFAATVAGA